MTRKNYAADALRIEAQLQTYEAAHGKLPGVVDPAIRAALIEQIIDSEQRVEYFSRLRARDLDASSTDPSSPGVDPLKASILQARAGDYDEAVWLIFLFVHFGKHSSAGWRYVRDVYGRLGGGDTWNWKQISADPTSFRFWLDEHQEALKAGPGPRGFSNHRKYQSLNAWEPRGTGEAVESYADWVLRNANDHKGHFDQYPHLSSTERFASLYTSMADVAQFGRIARFDYLTTLMKLRLVAITVPHSYLVGATGPLRGAQLLLRGEIGEGRALELQTELSTLSDLTGLRPDVLEDAICNWQKTPDHYVRFSG
jgi:hypothetical protein